MAGLFITFEGVDGSGKSTHAELLAECLRSMGQEVILTREPGGCGISEKIRDLLLDAENGAMTPQTEALLYAAARAQHVAEVIRPALEAGKTVISDRFLDSSLAYQGAGRQLGWTLIEQVNQPAVEEIRPDITFFLDYPPDLAFQRIERIAPLDRLEKQDAPFYERLYAEFVRLQEREPERIRRIDVSGTKQETQEKIQKEVRAFLAGQGGLR